jgi:hypothetical protein
MALSCNTFANQTVAATQCELVNAPICQELVDQPIGPAQQYAILIDTLDRLVKKTTPTFTINAVATNDIIQANTNARCALADRQSFAAIPEEKILAVLVYLANQAACNAGI